MSFFVDLEDGEEYISFLMKSGDYHAIPNEYKMLFSMQTVRRNNSAFKDDETHKALIKAQSKAKKELRDYEFEINNK